MVRRKASRRGLAALSGLALAALVTSASMPAFAVQAQEQAQGQLVAQLTGTVRAQAIDAASEEFEPDEIIVIYRDDVAAAEIEDEPATIPGASVEVIAGGEQGTTEDDPAMALVALPEGMSVGQAVIAAEDDPNVAHAQPNYRYHALEGPVTEVAAAQLAQSSLVPHSVAVDDEYANNAVNNKAIPNQWWLSSVRAQDAWEYAKCDNKVTVAVLDTGINFEHADLAPNVLSDYAWDATADDEGAPLTESPSTAVLSHGSHVAGIAAARANNAVGIAGASYNANILPICVFTAAGGQAMCDDADLVKAYNYLFSDEDGDGRTVAQETNTRVVNMSLGGYGASGASDEVLHAAIVRAEEAGILTVAAGGNGDGFGNPRTEESYPSDFDEVMSVVALESDAQRVEWSDYNSHKDISAPGVNIWSTWWTGDEYECESGTSMASPLVAGCAALLWAFDPDLSVAQVKDALYSTAVDLGTLGKDDYYGWGRIDVASALESLGTAHINAERTTMGRTGTQTLTASDVADPSLEHTWKWSVPRGADVVSVGEDTGVVRALKAGSAVVHVEAEDSPEVAGNISLTVTEITVPGAISVVSDGVAHQMVVKWKAADAAVLYRVMRSTSKDGTFATIAEVAAQSGSKTYSYEDADVQVATDYYYRVLPIGQLDGDYFEGALSTVARGFFTDKAALSANIDQAAKLAASAIVSADGADVAQSERWVGQVDLDKFKAALGIARRVFASSSAKQMTVDTAARSIASAITDYQAALKTGTKVEAAPAPAPQTSETTQTSAVTPAVTPAVKPAVEPTAAPEAILRGDVKVASATYTGKARTPRVVVTHAGKILAEKTHYTLKWANNVKAGKGRVTVTGVGSYTGSQTVTFTISKAKNTLKVKAKSASVKQSKKKARTIAAKQVLSVSKARGKVTYSRIAKGSSKWLSKINAKTGAITLKKGAPKKNFSVKVKVKAAGTANYRAASKTVTVKVKVK